MKSIMQSEKRCYLCGREGAGLDRHHCLQGGSRNIAEKYGLTVWLCHEPCHLKWAHRDPDTNKMLKRAAQEAAMKFYGWSIDDWRINTLQKNFLEE